MDFDMEMRINAMDAKLDPLDSLQDWIEEGVEGLNQKLICDIQIQFHAAYTAAMSPEFECKVRAQAERQFPAATEQQRIETISHYVEIFVRGLIDRKDELITEAYEFRDKNVAEWAQIILEHAEQPV